VSPISAIIFSGFGGLWLVAAIFAQRSPTPSLCVVPIVIAAVLAGWSVSVARKQTPLAPNVRKRLNKIVMYASTFEGVAIFVGVNVLDNLGMAQQILPLVAVVVGLHFLPFARFLPDRRYYPIALSLMTIGFVGAIIRSSDLRAWFVGASCALVLWTASIIAIRAPNRANLSASLS
jgi:hypothetical protein